MDGPLATNDHKAQTPCWIASYALAHPKQRRVKLVWLKSLRFGAYHVLLPLSMIDFVPYDGLLQKAYWQWSAVCILKTQYLLGIDIIQVVLNKLHAGSKVCLIELVRNVPAQRTKLTTFLWRTEIEYVTQGTIRASNADVLFGSSRNLSSQPKKGLRRRLTSNVKFWMRVLNWSWLQRHNQIITNLRRKQQLDSHTTNK